MTVVPLRSELQIAIEALYQVLPFTTRAEGAKALSRELGRKVSVPQLDYYLRQLRSDPKRWTFSIPFSEKGPPGAAGLPRYVCVDLDSENKPYFNPQEKGQVRAGLYSCIAHVLSMLTKEGEAISLAVPYHESPRLQRMARRFVKGMERMAEDAVDLLEAVDEADENGNSA